MTSIRLDTPLGSGKYGTVYRVDYYGTPSALKIFGSTTTNRAKMSPEARDAFNQECERIKTCKHENIVQYVGTKTICIDGQKYPALLMTLMDISLHMYLSFQEEDLLPHKEIKIALDVAKALNYLHEKAKFVHGDLHCGNVLLKCISANEGPIVKLCDFGLTKVISDISQHHHEIDMLTASNSITGFIEDPENSVTQPLIEGYHNNDVLCDPKDIEIRRFGTVMWRIHMRRSLDVGSNHDQNLHEIKGRPLYDMVKRCWDEVQPSALNLIGLLRNKKKEYPVVDPCSMLQETIASQQTTIEKLQETIDSQQKTIETLTTKLCQ